MKTFDYLIVGSGCSAAMAAQTLVEAGADVTMLDAGAHNPAYTSMVPEGDYLTLRKGDADQHRYFIGEKATGVLWGDIGKGAQLTPPRQHMVRYVDELLPITSTSFSPMESLGYGGLGIAWGLQCWEYSDADLAAAGLNPKAMQAAYETVAQRIGISGTMDDAGRYALGSLKTYQPSLKMDRNHQRIYDKYTKHKKELNAQGFYMGRTPLALLSKNKDGRKKYAYRDMDFYDDNGRSAWRPWMTVDDLRKRDNFHYIGGYLVLRFREKKDAVEVICLNIEDGTIEHFACKRLLLATGALGTARIVLRSQEGLRRLPLLCNPYTYIPCLQPRLLGKAAEAEKLGFAQLSLFLDENRDNFDISVASLYSYQSLMLFRIIRQAPLSFREARVLMRYLMPGIEIMGVHHPDAGSDSKYLELRPDATTRTGDRLHPVYTLAEADKARFREREKKFIRAMRTMGAYAFKRLDPGYGASIHYAGTLPFSNKEEAGHLADDGRLRGTKHVYVADSSGFTYLPARGLTFTLLANAHRVAEKVVQHG